MAYIWQHTEWPDLQWDPGRVDTVWFDAAGHLLGCSNQETDGSSLSKALEPLLESWRCTPQALLDLHRLFCGKGAGSWRDDARGPMLVATGSRSRRIVHYQAPPADRIASEIGALVDWLAAHRREPALLQSAIAFLWLVAIHPFSDGNGRVARALADMTFCRAQGCTVSLSARLRLDRKDYYPQIESALKGSVDISGWLAWFGERAHGALGQETQNT